MGGSLRPKLWSFFVTAALLTLTLIATTASATAMSAASTSTVVSARLGGDLGYLPLHPSGYANAKVKLDAQAAATGRLS